MRSAHYVNRFSVLEEEGLEASFAHQPIIRLVEGLSRLGLDMAVSECHRLPQLNAVLIPEGWMMRDQATPTPVNLTSRLVRDLVSWRENSGGCVLAG